MKTLGLGYTLFLALMFVLLTRMHPTAQDIIPTSQPELIDAQKQIIDGLMIVIGGLLIGFVGIVGTAIYALYKSVPPTFQSAFLEGLRGVIAIAEDTLAKRAVEAEKTTTTVDDRLIKVLIEAVNGLRQKVDNTP